MGKSNLTVASRCVLVCPSFLRIVSLGLVTAWTFVMFSNKGKPACVNLLRTYAPDDSFLKYDKTKFYIVNPADPTDTVCPEEKDQLEALTWGEGLFNLDTTDDARNYNVSLTVDQDLATIKAVQGDDSSSDSLEPVVTDGSCTAFFNHDIPTENSYCQAEIVFLVDVSFSEAYSSEVLSYYKTAKDIVNHITEAVGISNKTSPSGTRSNSIAHLITFANDATLYPNSFDQIETLNDALEQDMVLTSNNRTGSNIAAALYKLNEAIHKSRTIPTIHDKVIPILIMFDELERLNTCEEKKLVVEDSNTKEQPCVELALANLRYGAFDLNDDNYVNSTDLLQSGEAFCNDTTSMNIYKIGAIAVTGKYGQADFSNHKRYFKEVCKDDEQQDVNQQDVETREIDLRRGDTNITKTLDFKFLRSLFSNGTKCLCELETQAPTQSPTISPTSSAPTQMPSLSPSREPTTPDPTSAPSLSPSRSPTQMPSLSPSREPTTPDPTSAPSLSPSRSPTTPEPSRTPSKSPSLAPTQAPTPDPTKAPTLSPTLFPSQSPTQSPLQCLTVEPQRLPYIQLIGCSILVFTLALMAFKAFKIWQIEWTPTSSNPSDNDPDRSTPSDNDPDSSTPSDNDPEVIITFMWDVLSYAYLLMVLICSSCVLCLHGWSGERFLCSPEYLSPADGTYIGDKEYCSHFNNPWVAFILLSVMAHLLLITRAEAHWRIVKTSSNWKFRTPGFADEDATPDEDASPDEKTLPKKLLGLLCESFIATLASFIIFFRYYPTHHDSAHGTECTSSSVNTLFGGMGIISGLLIVGLIFEDPFRIVSFYLLVTGTPKPEGTPKPGITLSDRDIERMKNGHYVIVRTPEYNKMNIARITDAHQKRDVPGSISIHYYGNPRVDHRTVQAAEQNIPLNDRVWKPGYYYKSSCNPRRRRRYTNDGQGLLEGSEIQDLDVPLERVIHVFPKLKENQFLPPGACAKFAEHQDDKETTPILNRLRQVWSFCQGATRAWFYAIFIKLASMIFAVAYLVSFVLLLSTVLCIGFLWLLWKLSQVLRKSSFPTPGLCWVFIACALVAFASIHIAVWPENEGFGGTAATSVPASFFLILAVWLFMYNATTDEGQIGHYAGPFFLLLSLTLTPLQFADSESGPNLNVSSIATTTSTNDSEAEAWMKAKICLQIALLDQMLHAISQVFNMMSKIPYTLWEYIFDRLAVFHESPELMALVSLIQDFFNPLWERLPVSRCCTKFGHSGQQSCKHKQCTEAQTTDSQFCTEHRSRCKYRQVECTKAQTTDSQFCTEHRSRCKYRQCTSEVQTPSQFCTVHDLGKRKEAAVKTILVTSVSMVMVALNAVQFYAVALDIKRDWSENDSLKSRAILVSLVVVAAVISAAIVWAKSYDEKCTSSPRAQPQDEPFISESGMDFLRTKMRTVKNASLWTRRRVKVDNSGDHGRLSTKSPTVTGSLDPSESDPAV